MDEITAMAENDIIFSPCAAVYLCTSHDVYKYFSGYRTGYGC